jgi:hypothetical protein
VVEAAIEIVGRVGITEQAGEPQAEITRVDRHDDIAFVVDYVLERRQGIATLTQHRVVDQACSLPRLQRLKGMRI